MKTDKGETLFRVPFVLLRALIVLRPEKVELRGEEEEEEAEGFGASGILLVLIHVSRRRRSRERKSEAKLEIECRRGEIKIEQSNADKEIPFIKLQTNALV